MGTWTSGDGKRALYRVAFDRLNLQSEYLDKLNTAFLIVNGALAAGAFSKGAEQPRVVAIAAGLGVVFSVLWLLAVIHNNHWHRYWTVKLHDLEPAFGVSKEVTLFHNLRAGFKDQMERTCGRRQPNADNKHNQVPPTWPLRCKTPIRGHWTWAVAAMFIILVWSLAGSWGVCTASKQTTQKGISAGQVEGIVHQPRVGAARAGPDN